MAANRQKPEAVQRLKSQLTKTLRAMIIALLMISTLGFTQVGAAQPGAQRQADGQVAIPAGTDPRGLLSDSSMNPELVRWVSLVLSDLVDAGYRPKIVSGFRSFDAQQALYDQGRSKPGNIVTNARPGSSYHNYGLAVDVAVQGRVAYPDPSPFWDALGEAGEAHDLTWGGRWTRPDRPHLELHPGLNASQASTLKDEYFAGGLSEVWASLGLSDAVRPVVEEPPAADSPDDRCGIATDNDGTTTWQLGRRRTVRTGPSLDCPTITTLDRGSLINVANEQRVTRDGFVWAPTLASGDEGWMAVNRADGSGSVLEQPPATEPPAADSPDDRCGAAYDNGGTTLWLLGRRRTVRTGPSLDCPTVTTLDQSAIITVAHGQTVTRDGFVWAPTFASAGDGWMAINRADGSGSVLEEPPDVVTADNPCGVDANYAGTAVWLLGRRRSVRTGPSLDCPTVTTLGQGAIISVTSSAVDDEVVADGFVWDYVLSSGHEGWMAIRRSDGSGSVLEEAPDVVTPPPAGETTYDVSATFSNSLTTAWRDTNGNDRYKVEFSDPGSSVFFNVKSRFRRLTGEGWTYTRWYDIRLCTDSHCELRGTMDNRWEQHQVHITVVGNRGDNPYSNLIGFTYY